MSAILITGGTGFAGTHLVQALMAAGTPAESIHITTRSQAGANATGQLAGVHQHQLDFLDEHKVSELLQVVKPDQMYHLASSARTSQSFVEARDILQNNITLQLNVLESVRDHAPAARVLFVSSAEVYQSSQQPIDEHQPLEPLEPYGVSKVTQEFLTKSFAAAFHLQCVIVRPFNHIGAGQSPDFVVSSFAQQVAKVERGLQHSIQVGNLSSVRDFTDVDDMVKAYMLLMSQGEAGQVYNAGSGRGVTIQTILDTLISLAKTPVTIEVDSSRIRPVDVPYSVANASKLEALGWSATIPLEVTLENILNDWRSRV